MSDGPGIEAETPPLLRKCDGPVVDLVRWARSEGLYPYFLPIEGGDAAVVRIEGEEKIMLGSNNYLGITHHPRVLEAAGRALDRYGSGATGSRFLTGNTDLHDRLEERLAAFLGKEDALVFTTGYQANVGIISALVGRSDTVFLDRRAHASIVDGALLCTGEMERFHHGDVDELETLLEEAGPDAGKLVVTDGVFSMEGDVAPLPRLVSAARRHGAVLLLDDAHGLGVLGERGAGTAEHFDLTDEVDLIMATFSKSLASVGGVVAGDVRVLDHLRHSARSLIFSASMPPASAAGVLAALEVLEAEPELRERLWSNSERLRDGLEATGLGVRASETPIVPVEVGGIERTARFWRALYDRGVFVHPVIPPAVPPNSCLIRVSVTAAHSEEHVERVLDAFRGAVEDVGIDGGG